MMVLSTLAFVLCALGGNEVVDLEEPLRGCKCPFGKPMGKPTDKRMNPTGKFGGCPNFACGIKNACLKPADQKIWNGVIEPPAKYNLKPTRKYTGRNLFFKDIGALSRGCWGHQPCIQDRMEELRGYSKKCSYCMGEVGNCYARHCSGRGNHTWGRLPDPKPPCTDCNKAFYECAKVIPGKKA